ncbi:MAG: AAA family ATPase [Gammaproteobacteria bacterium]
MYEDYFQLKCRPFDLAPDPRFLYLTEQHARAVANVRFALMNHDSFVVITGEIGTGKTTVLNAALEQLGSNYVVARLSHTTLNDIELLQALLSEFGMPDYDTRKVRLLDQLRAHFLEQHDAGRHVVVIVDEAQHLSSAAIEELRLLSGIDQHDRRIVSIALTGQPSLDDVIDEESLAPLRQRTRLRQRLRPMHETDSIGYIRHRIKVAGGDADAIFTPEALHEIHRLTLGTPRLINTLCDSALMVCRVDAQTRVDMETIAGVVKDLGWRWSEPSQQRSGESDQAVSVGVSSPLQASAILSGQADERDKLWLRAYSYGRLVAKVGIESFPFTIGRQPGNSLVLAELEISRRHALINRVGDRYIIEDLHSINGILVNGRRCDTAVLSVGDIVRIGLVDLVFDAGDERTERQIADPDATGDSLPAMSETQSIHEDNKTVAIGRRRRGSRVGDRLRARFEAD